METIKILGQSQPAANVVTATYTVPSDTAAVVSTIAICNTTSAAATARVHVVKSGFSATTANALIYDTYIQPYDTTSLTLGITLAEGDSIQVQTATSLALTFHAFGSEIAVQAA